MRLVSLVPSITETLFDLGVPVSQVVGKTKFCIHPQDQVKNAAIIGGTKNLNIPKIKALKPDLIIANKEENTQEQIVELQKDFKVMVTAISTLEDNYYLLKNLGNLLRKTEMAQHFNLKIYEIFQNIPAVSYKKCAYLIWRNPYMTVGSDTFIHEILSQLGFENIFKSHRRYPEVAAEDLKDAEYVFLSSEPYPFSKKHAEELQRALPDAKIVLVDGEAFSWYGTHLAKCENYFRHLLAACK